MLESPYLNAENCVQARGYKLCLATDFVADIGDFTIELLDCESLNSENWVGFQRLGSAD